MCSKKITKQSINIITLGCSKNLVDSEVFGGKISNDYNVYMDNYSINPDIVIINTCGFINDAKEESINVILENIQAKNENKIKKIYVFGCLTERYRETIINEMPEVDGIFGVADTDKLIDELKVEKISENRIISTPNHYAYLKISEGCNWKCSFCAIPNIRGKFKSKPIEEIVKEAQNLADKGVKEIILVAQDLSYYGLDIYKKRNLSKLVNKLSEIEKIEWIRLHYFYPSQFPLDVIETIKNNSKVCKYIDIPVQHINDRILASMKRGISRQDTINLIQKFRSQIPDVAIRTSIIVGYPGETKAEFNELLKFIEETKFDRLGVFKYSHEEDTPAFILKDNVSEKEKENRAGLIMNIQQEISLESNKQFVGKTIRVIIDREENDYFIGRSQYDSPEIDNEILVTKEKNIKIGEFYNVLIEEASDFDLFGKIICLL